MQWPLPKPPWPQDDLEKFLGSLIIKKTEQQQAPGIDGMKEIIDRPAEHIYLSPVQQANKS